MSNDSNNNLNDEEAANVYFNSPEGQKKIQYAKERRKELEGDLPVTTEAVNDLDGMLSKIKAEGLTSDPTKTSDEQIASLQAALESGQSANAPEALVKAAQLQARFDQLHEDSINEFEAEARARAAYHHNQEDVNKDNRAQAEASASKERKSRAFDPFEMLKQVEAMREEGVDEDTIRTAFNELMEERSGNFRKPMRRITQSEGMIPVMSQTQINELYEAQMKANREAPTDADLEHVKRIINESQEAMNNLTKVTFKMRLYRVAYFFLRRPLRFMIAFLKALKDNDDHYT